MIGFGCIKDVDDLFDFLEGEVPCIDTSEKIMHIEKAHARPAAHACAAAPTALSSSPKKTASPKSTGQSALTCGYCVPVCPVRAIILY